MDDRADGFLFFKRKVDVHFVVHRIHPKLFAVMDENPARLIFPRWKKRVAGIFLPMNEVG